MIIQKYKAADTRRHKRMLVSYLVKFQVAGVDEAPYVANVKDLSAGGVRFWSSYYLPEGTLLNLSVLIPPIDLVMEAVGRIARVRQSKDGSYFYFGISFIEIQAHQQIALNEFIENLAKTKKANFLVPDPGVIFRENPLQIV